MSLPRFSTAKQCLCLTMDSKIGNCIPKRSNVEHPGWQSSSKERSVTNNIYIYIYCHGSEM